MFWPTYSMTISSAAMGSMANRPQSWMWLLQNLSFFFRNLGREGGGVRPWPRPRCHPGRPGGGGRTHLELVELEQVAVTAASEGGQQAALLGAPLGAGPRGGVRLRGDAHALRGRRGSEEGRGPRATGRPCPSLGDLAQALRPCCPNFFALVLSVPVLSPLVTSLSCQYLTCSSSSSLKENDIT